ncbi:hypothetical protein CR513_00760, partial [Mucuna pruriens]
MYSFQIWKEFHAPLLRLIVINGGWWNIAEGQKIPPYKHASAAYGTAIAGLPSQIAYGRWQKICHATIRK